MTVYIRYQPKVKHFYLLFVLGIASKGFQTTFFAESSPVSESALPQRVMRTPKCEDNNFWERLMFFMCHLLCVGMSAVDSQNDNYFINKCTNYKQEMV